MAMDLCGYCHPKNENVIWRDDVCRVLLVEGSPFTGWCRVVWNEHCPELSDLNDAQRHHLMTVVATVEKTIRAYFSPKTINLASLGTALPHLHWHIIPRYQDDSHFPEPVWCQPVRQGLVRDLPADFAPALKQACDKHNK